MKDDGRKGFRLRWYTRAMNWYRDTVIVLPFFNVTVRLIMALKYLFDRSHLNIRYRGKETEIQKWFEKTRMFFGFSSIRGGTVFLSNMLMLELENAHIEHEANMDDYWNYPKTLQDDHEALQYIQNFRKKDIYHRCAHSISLYGEVNPMLRIHCKAIKELFPHAKLFHMVRDPRDVIRSIMSKEILGPKDPLRILIRPRRSDPYFEQWGRMTRFEKLCWQWQNDNRIMREVVPHFTRFEEMLTDYDYFKEYILDYLDIEIPKKRWETYVRKPENITKRHRLKGWEDWGQEKLDALHRICGEEMGHYGYTQ